MKDLDPNELRRMDDRQLASLVTQIADIAGADRRKTAELLGDLNGLRESLGRLTPEQAKQLLDYAGETKSREIYRLLQKNRP